MILFGARTKSIYNFDIMIELTKSSKFLGNFVLNEKLFIQDDLKGNQFETLGIFFFLERLMVVQDEALNEILKLKLNTYALSMKSLIKNIEDVLSIGNLEILEEIYCHYIQTEQSYFYNILNWSSCQRLQFKWLSNGDENSLNELKYYYEHFFSKFENFNFLNTDFLVGDLCGIFYNNYYL